MLFNDSLVKLCAWLCRNSGLKASDVIHHYDVTGKLCPLYYAKNQEAWDQFIKDVEKAMKKKLSDLRYTNLKAF